MTTNQQGLLRFARERYPVVSRCVVVMLNRQTGQLGFQPLPGLQPRVRPCNSLRAVLIAREFAQLFQFGDGSRRINRPRFLSPVNCPSFTCTLPRTITAHGLPSIGVPSNAL